MFIFIVCAKNTHAQEQSIRIVDEANKGTLFILNFNR